MAAFLDNDGMLLILYRTNFKPYTFNYIQDLLRIGSRIRGPIYVSNILQLFTRLKSSLPELIRTADVKIRSSGGINNIKFNWEWHGLEHDFNFINADTLNMPDRLKVSDKLDYIDTLRKCCGFWPRSVGAAAMKFYQMRSDIHPAGLLSPEQRDFVRCSYFGGFNYLRPGVRDVVHGYIYDINKLYAYILAYKPLPLGTPVEYAGDIPKVKYPGYQGFYFHKFRVSADLRPGCLPFIQLRHDWSVKQGYQSRIRDKELILSRPDFELFKKNYRILSYTPIGGLDFEYYDKMFREHILEIGNRLADADTEGKRAAYKILANALYGQYGKRDIEGRTVYKDGIFSYDADFTSKSTAYVPVASAIAAWGRSIIIPAAQRERDNFIYSDTDSIHTFRRSRYITPSSALGAFKLESEFLEGRYFGRRKYTLLLQREPERKKVIMAGLPSGSTDEIPFDKLRNGFKIPMIRRYIHPDGTVEKVDTFYEI